MNEIDTFSVKVAGAQGSVACEVVVFYEPSISMKLVMPGETPMAFEGNDLFESMKSLRRHLEQREMLLLCNGARVDSYPSQMSRQMGHARRVYLATMGQQTRREDLVDIFGEAPVEKIGSVDAQRAYHDDWLRSLGWEI